MSFLKKIKDLFVDDISDEAEDKDVISQGDITKYVGSTSLDDETPRVLDSDRKEIVESDIAEEEKKTSSFVDISADEEPGNKKKNKGFRTREVTREATRETSRESVREPREEEFGLRDDPYVSVDVISPLFGKVDEEESEQPKATKPLKSNKTSSVISPMFGKMNDVPKTKEKEEKLTQPKLESFSASEILSVMDTEEEDGIELSSMLSKDNEETLDETTQISLFGDHVSVHKQEQDLFELEQGKPQEDEVQEDQPVVEEE